MRSRPEEGKGNYPSCLPGKIPEILRFVFNEANGLMSKVHSNTSYHEQKKKKIIGGGWKEREKKRKRGEGIIKYILSTLEARALKYFNRAGTLARKLL